MWQTLIILSPGLLSQIWELPIVSDTPPAGHEILTEMCDKFIQLVPPDHLRVKWCHTGGQPALSRPVSLSREDLPGQSRRDGDLPADLPPDGDLVPADLPGAALPPHLQHFLDDSMLTSNFLKVGIVK